MSRVLLVGNGLNRCAADQLSWNDIVSDLAGRCGVPSCSELPMPIEFERIGANDCSMLGYTSNRSKDKYLDMKRYLVQCIKDANLHPTELHRDLESLHPDAILTTNYDLVLECAFRCEDRIKSLPGKTKYPLAATSEDGVEPKFYHVHGIITTPFSMCVGYDHYMGYVRRVRSEFFCSSASQPIVDVIKAHRKPSTWVEWLFSANVAIIGLGLDFEEVDLWWLLSCRAALYNSSDDLKKDSNRVTYYDVELEDDSNSRINKRRVRNKALEGFGVLCKSVKSSSYESGYKKIIQKIKKDWEDA